MTFTISEKLKFSSMFKIVFSMTNNELLFVLSARILRTRHTRLELVALFFTKTHSTIWPSHDGFSSSTTPAFTYRRVFVLKMFNIPDLYKKSTEWHVFNLKTLSLLPKTMGSCSGMNMYPSLKKRESEGWYIPAFTIVNCLTSKIPESPYVK